MPKRRKSARKTQNFDAKIDRISDLPDSILAHILGKLSTKNAVGTAVLSTRWKLLFSQIPNPDISIDDAELLYPDPESPLLHYKISDLLYHRRKANFIKFMYNLLDVTLRDVPRIRKFHLKLDINYDCDYNEEKGYFCSDHVNKWISAALRLNVSYLWFFCTNNFNGSPEEIFCSASLVEIMLHWNAGINVPSSVCLPNLKCLYLKQVLFHDDDLKKVISGCPVLEELCLCYCEFLLEKYTDVDSHVVRIFSPSVKSFKWFRCIKEHELKYGIEFDMPALNSLCYDDYLPNYFLVKNLNSLRKAYIDPWPTLAQLESSIQEDHVHYLKNVADLVSGCSNVEFLSLSNHSIEAMCSINSLYPFHNLIKLELPKIEFHGWMLLPYLLKNAPNLENLVFAKGFHVFKGYYKMFFSHVGQCPAFNLQMIRFEDFGGEVEEINLMNFFLKNAKKLRKIEIKLSFLCEEKLVKAASKIEALQKRSKKCQIELIFGVFGEQKNKTDRSFGMREW